MTNESPTESKGLRIDSQTILLFANFHRMATLFVSLIQQDVCLKVIVLSLQSITHVMQSIFFFALFLWIDSFVYHSFHSTAAQKGNTSNKALFNLLVMMMKRVKSSLRETKLSLSLSCFFSSLKKKRRILWDRTFQCKKMNMKKFVWRWLSRFIQSIATEISLENPSFLLWNFHTLWHQIRFSRLHFIRIFFFQVNVHSISTRLQIKRQDQEYKTREEEEEEEDKKRMQWNESNNMIWPTNLSGCKLSLPKKVSLLLSSLLGLLFISLASSPILMNTKFIHSQESLHQHHLVNRSFPQPVFSFRNCFTPLQRDELTLEKFLSFVFVLRRYFLSLCVSGICVSILL